VITGGASGVGRALGARLAAEGAKVVLSDVDSGRLDETVAELAAEGDVRGVAADVTRADSVERLADEVFRLHGAVHLLFNNAGVAIGDFREPIWSLPLKDWRWGFDVHVMGVVHGLRAFVPRMLAGGEEGWVVNTTSGNGGVASSSRTPVYASSKAAVTSLSEVLHLQLKAQGGKIRAGVLFPGPHLVNTNLMRPARPPEYVDDGSPPPPGKTMAELAQQSGGVPLTEPEEVADFALACIREGRFWMLPASERTESNIRARAQTMIDRLDPQPLMG
jgi:NAD(P)-dependent dehydrogenase (short-subunit alcohol dehydrogenase family)